MKTKIVVLFILVALNGFSKNVKKDTLFQMCNKKCYGKVEMTLSEFLKCDKRIKALVSGDSVLYYEITLSPNGASATMRYDYRSNKPSDIDFIFNRMKKGDAFVIERVGIYRKNKIVEFKGFTIIFK